jgi:hypothetical protein
MVDPTTAAAAKSTISMVASHDHPAAGAGSVG